MLISIRAILYLLVACVFAVFAIAYFDSTKKNRKLVWIAIESFLICIASLNYVLFMLTDSLAVKEILFTLHVIFIVALYYLVFVFLLSLAKPDCSFRNRFGVLVLIAFFALSYALYPFSKIIPIISVVDWHVALNDVFAKPSSYLFVLVLVVMFIYDLQTLFDYYFQVKNIRNKKISVRIMSIVLSINIFLILLDFILKYILQLRSSYYDISILMVSVFTLVVIICQKSFYLIYTEIDANIYKMVDKIPDSIGVFDSNLRLRWCNESFKSLFSEGGIQVIEKTIKDSIHANTSNNASTGKTKFQTTHRKNGTVYDLLFSLLPIYSKDNHIQFLVLYVQDITSFEKRKLRISKQRKVLEQRILAKTLLIKRRNLKLKKMLAEKVQIEEKNFSILNYDIFTKLFNRKTMIQKIDSLIRKKSVLYLMYIDIDDVRMFNDSFGYDVINLLIGQIADRIIADLKYDKAVSRFGGDEFLIVFDETTPIQEASLELQKLLAEPFIVDGVSIKITVSIGVSKYPDDGIDAVSLIRFADMAMYEAKERGKNTISFFEATLRKKIEKDFIVSERIKEELSTGRMKIFATPVVNIDNLGRRSIYGVNILAYWNSQGAEVLEGEDFVESLRRSGILKTFDRWIVKAVIKTFAESNLHLSNTSSKLILHISDKAFYSPIFFDYLLEVLSNYKILPENVEVELSETTLMLQPDLAIKNINQCQQFGIAVVVKDFGLTYSSLTYLDRFNISKIKISKIFVSEIGKNVKDEGIIKLLISLSERINTKIIAEGVDTLEQLQFLLDNGCRYFEGSFFSNPMHFEDLLKIMDASEIVV